MHNWRERCSRAGGSAGRHAGLACVVGLWLLLAVPLAWAEPVPSGVPESRGDASQASAEAVEGRPMTLLEVAVIAAVEGVTEFLPISSTGHILLAQRAMGVPQTEAADAFAVVIQGGAILAVLGLYRHRGRQVALGLAGRDPTGLRLFGHVMLAFAPFAVVAWCFYDEVKDLFGIWESIAGWFVGGLVILAAAWWRRDAEPDEGRTMEQLNWRAALVIGVVQCTAMWPGTSRAWAAMLGGLVVGMSIKSAVEFSFLLGVVTLLAAAAYDAWMQGDHIFNEYGLLVPVVGFAVAALSAAVAVKWMVHYLERYSIAIFGYYRVALAIVVAGLILGGWLHL